MKIKQYKHILLLILFFSLTFILYLWFLNTPYFQLLTSWSRQNLVIFIISLIVIKTIGIVWPPIPGGLVTLGSIPILGWQLAYISDLTGSLIGSSIAYFIGKKYGLPFLKKIFDESTIDKIKKIKIIKKREVEAVFALRILTGSTIVEAVCYAAGVLKIHYFNFLIGSLLSHITLGLPIYYFAFNVFDAKRVTLNIIIILIAMIILLKFKGRYLE